MLAEDLILAEYYPLCSMYAYAFDKIREYKMLAFSENIYTLEIYPLYRYFTTPISPHAHAGPSS